MGDKSAIEWTEATWNPIRGCSRVSEGCRHCYAERVAIRQSGNGGSLYTAPGAYHGLVKSTPAGPRWTGEVRFVEEALALPLRWTKPRRIFVNSMSDLFHEKVEDAWIEQIIGIIGTATRHTFQVLTKRPGRMFEWFNRRAHWTKNPPIVYEKSGFPPRNLHLGVSVEDQATAADRIWHLLHTPAAVHFVSYEPALAGVDFTRLDYTAQLREFMRRAVGDEGAASVTGPAWINALTGEWFDGWDGGIEKDRRLSWVIAGGESGPGARPPHPDWFRGARDQCVAAGVQFFFKQWGEWAPHPNPPIRGTNTGGGLFVLASGRLGNQGDFWDGRAAAMDRVGKKAAGRLLDGREWNEFPR